MVMPYKALQAGIPATRNHLLGPGDALLLALVHLEGRALTAIQPVGGRTNRPAHLARLAQV